MITESDAARASCTSRSPASRPESEVLVRTDVSYGAKATSRMDVYRPARALSDKAAVLLVHGGGFENGDKGQDFYRIMGKAFASGGVVTFSLNYTLSAPADRPAPRARDLAVGDVLAALAYIREHAEDFGLREPRFVIQGDSAGGAVVTKLALSYGRDAGIIGCINMWGGMPAQAGESPYPWGGRIYSGEISAGRAVPFLLIHGTADPVAPLEVSVRLKAALDEKSVPNTLIRLEGAQHYPEERADDMLSPIQTFAADCIHNAG